MFSLFGKSNNSLRYQLFFIINRCLFYIVCLEDHLFSNFSLLGVIVVHSDQRFSCNHFVTNFLGIFESYGEINLVSCYFAASTKSDYCKAKFVAFDAMNVPTLRSGNIFLVFSDSHFLGDISTLSLDHFEELFEACPTLQVLLHFIRLSCHL